MRNNETLPDLQAEIVRLEKVNSVLLETVLGPSAQHKGACPTCAHDIQSLDALVKLKTTKASPRSHKPIVDEYRQRLLDANFKLLRARDEAIKINTSKTRFLAVASHDLLQPLNAGRLLLESLSRTQLSDLQREMVNRLNSTTEAALALFQKLLHLSRLDSIQEEVEIKLFPIAEVLEQIMIEIFSVNRNKDLVVTYIPSTAVVKSHPLYLRQMISNLIGNAIKYTQRGKVIVGCRFCPPDLIRIQVCDSGAGIPSDEQLQLFKEFFRGKKAKENTDGLGLGLAICSRLSRLLHHQISCISVEGRGTIFSIDVPYAGRCVSINTTEQVRVKPHQSPQRFHPQEAGVMIIEDNVDISFAMQLIAREWGFTPWICNGLQEALALLRQHRHTDLKLMIADYHLEQGEFGTTVIEKVREYLQSEIPAVIISADQSQTILEKSKEMNCRMLQKPITREQLEELFKDLFLTDAKRAHPAEDPYEDLLR